MLLSWLRSGWPLAGVAVVFLGVLVAAGVGAAVVAATVSILVFGPAYLVQNAIRRRRGTLPEPAPRTPAEEARADAQFLRAAAVCDVALAVGMVAAAVERGDWLSGRGWTAAGVVYAALGLSFAPMLWALAEQRASGRSLRWAWALSAGLAAVCGIVAAVVAVANLRSRFVGGGGWTAGLGALAAYWLLRAVVDLRRARIEVQAGV